MHYLKKVRNLKKVGELSFEKVSKIKDELKSLENLPEVQRYVKLKRELEKESVRCNYINTEIKTSCDHPVLLVIDEGKRKSSCLCLECNEKVESKDKKKFVYCKNPMHNLDQIHDIYNNCFSKDDLSVSQNILQNLINNFVPDHNQKLYSKAGIRK